MTTQQINVYHLHSLITVGKNKTGYSRVGDDGIFEFHMLEEVVHIFPRSFRVTGVEHIRSFQWREIIRIKTCGSEPINPGIMILNSYPDRLDVFSG